MSTADYYRSFHNIYKTAFGSPQMLHYPYYKAEKESLPRRQKNLSDHCYSFVKDWEGKDVLEVGCGNGMQALHLLDSHKIKTMTGIDLNEHNVEVAEDAFKQMEHVHFRVDNAQELNTIKDKSIDVLLCIESAFHYPDKQAFLNQVNRVLKDDGEFVIADILNKTHKSRTSSGKKYKNKMHLNHWRPDQYDEGFENAELSIIEREDITEKIIQGYGGYGKWISRKFVKNIFKYLVLRIFTWIQCELNVRLLKKRRYYIVFHGKKS